MKNTRDNRFEIDAREYEDMMWLYAANGRNAFDGLDTTEEEKDILAYSLTAAMKEYDRLFGDAENAPDYDKDADYRELIDGQFNELIRDMTAEKGGKNENK